MSVHKARLLMQAAHLLACRWRRSSWKRRMRSWWRRRSENGWCASTALTTYSRLSALAPTRGTPEHTRGTLITTHPRRTRISLCCAAISGACAAISGVCVCVCVCVCACAARLCGCGASQVRSDLAKANSDLEEARAEGAKDRDAANESLAKLGALRQGLEAAGEREKDAEKLLEVGGGSHARAQQSSAHAQPRTRAAELTTAGRDRYARWHVRVHLAYASMRMLLRVRIPAYASMRALR